jgi:hypothetical protein
LQLLIGQHLDELHSDQEHNPALDATALSDQTRGVPNDGLISNGSSSKADPNSFIGLQRMGIFEADAGLREIHSQRLLHLREAGISRIGGAASRAYVARVMRAQRVWPRVYRSVE